MRLTDILTEDQIQIPLKATDRDSAISLLIDTLDKKKIISNKEDAYNAVLEREKIMTTGVGNGIAIPHCKHASCPTFSVALGLPAKGIDFESTDKKNVKIIFLLVGPENNPSLHIKLLSRISRLMSNEELRDNVLSSKSPQKALQLLQDEENYYFDLE